MCTGACSKVIAVCLYVLALIAVICNIILFFPDFKTNFASNDSEDVPMLTPEVKYMGGVLGGGILVLIPAIHIHLTSAKNCCANRCGMFLSIGFAAIGVLGSIYSLSVAAVGLSKGPVCFFENKWQRPFQNTSGGYLDDKDLWEKCVQPDNVVQFNLGLFCILLAVSCLEIILCGIQMVNGLFGCCCGTCSGKD